MFRAVVLFRPAMIRWVQSHHLEVALLFLTLLFIVVGIWTHRAGREFRSVAESHGKGISHLMGAPENLLKLYPRCPRPRCPKIGLTPMPQIGLTPMPPNRSDPDAPNRSAPDAPKSV